MGDEKKGLPLYTFFDEEGKEVFSCRAPNISAAKSELMKYLLKNGD